MLHACYFTISYVLTLTLSLLLVIIAIYSNDSKLQISSRIQIRIVLLHSLNFFTLALTLEEIFYRSTQPIVLVKCVVASYLCPIMPVESLKFKLLAKY